MDKGTVRMNGLQGLVQALGARELALIVFLLEEIALETLLTSWTLTLQCCYSLGMTMHADRVFASVEHVVLIITEL